MRIDIHTHISPDRIAAPVLEGMTAQFGYPAVGVNTIEGLKSHMRASGVDKSVVLGVVDRVECVVIGAGVIGLAVARRLAMVCSK